MLESEAGWEGKVGLGGRTPVGLKRPGEVMGVLEAVLAACMKDGGGAKL